MSNPNMPQNPNQNPAQQDNVFAAAYHGVMRRMAQTRMNRAADVIERMDHKEALYDDLGRAAITGQVRISGPVADQRINAERVTALREGRPPRYIDRDGAIGPREFLASPTANDQPARPRTFGERWVDRRIDKRGEKKAVADIYSWRDAQIYGPERSFTDPVLRPEFNEPFRGPESLSGLNKYEKRVQKGNINDDRRRGNITAQEARVQKLAVAATPMKLGDTALRISTQRSQKADEQLRYSTDRKLISRWRNMRRRHAISRRQTAQVKVRKHTR